SENADGTITVVRDGDLVATAIHVDRHRPVEAGLRALNPADRRDVALRVGVVHRDRRLVEPSADHRWRLPRPLASSPPPRGGALASLPRRRVAGRRLTAALIAVVGDDDLVVLPVEEHAVRIAEACLWPADRP